jgi:hypothetical protein
MRIIFLHGWRSLTGSSPNDDFNAAVRIAQDEFEQGKPDGVIGSSRGGAVAMNINSGTAPLNWLNYPVAPRSPKLMMALRRGNGGVRPRR